MNPNVCQHDIFSEKFFNFCSTCGIILLPNSKSIKSSKYNYLIDNSPKSMFEIMKSASSRSTIINTNSNYLSKRSEIIKELRLYFNKLLYKNQTFYLAIHYLDIVTSLTKESRFDIMALTCLSLASKFDENDLNDLVLAEIEDSFANNKYSMKDLKKYEIFCLKLLEYKLNHYTAYHFISFFIAHGFVFTDDLVTIESSPLSKLSKEKSMEKLSDKVYSNSKEILYHFLDDANYIKYSPLEIACACVAISREVNNIQEIWPISMERVYFITNDYFGNCLSSIQKSISNKKLPTSDLSRYFSFKRSEGDGKRHSLVVNYEGAKILNYIEDQDSLKKLMNQTKNHKNSEDVTQGNNQELNFIRDGKKKQTYMNKGDVKFEIASADQKLKAKNDNEKLGILQINAFNKSNEIFNTSVNTSITKEASNEKLKENVQKIKYEERTKLPVVKK